MGNDDVQEEEELRGVALKNAESILIARRRAEEALLAAHEALEKKTRELQEQAVSALSFKCDLLWAQLEAIEAGDTRPGAGVE